MPRGWDMQHSPSHVSQPSRTWGFCTKSVPSVLPGMSQNFMSRFPTLALTPNPRISACLPAGMARNTYSQTKPFSKEYCSESRLTSEICFLFSFSFFLLLLCKTLHKGYCIFCNAKTRIVHIRTYRGYTSVTGITYPFKNCPN